VSDDLRELYQDIILDHGRHPRNFHALEHPTHLARGHNLRDLSVGSLSRPQANLADFYRELGHLFGVPLSPHNRWNSSKVLREKWLAHIEAATYRPVLLIDESQEMNSLVLAELRLLASAELDSQILLTTVLAGDGRLAERLRASPPRAVATFGRGSLAKVLPRSPGVASTTNDPSGRAAVTADHHAVICTPISRTVIPARQAASRGEVQAALLPTAAAASTRRGDASRTMCSSSRG
jgi:hypothetical protein